MQRLYDMDLWILDNIHQPIADWVWCMADVSCFTLAKICTTIAFATAAAIDLCFEPPKTIDYILCVVMGINATMSLYSVKIAEDRYNRKYANIFREIWRTVRLLCIVMTTFFLPMTVAPHNIQSLVWIIYSVAWVSIIYFASCNMRPPVERYQTKLVPVTQ